MRGGAQLDRECRVMLTLFGGAFLLSAACHSGWIVDEALAVLERELLRSLLTDRAAIDPAGEAAAGACC